MEDKNIFGPRNIKLIDVLINSAGAFISGIIGSILLLFIIFFVSGIIDVPGNIGQLNIGTGANNPLFPFILSFITFFISIIVSIVTYYFLTLTDPIKYKRTNIHLSQISFFSILTYIFFLPIYMYAGILSYDNLMVVFIIHILLLSFGINILLETLNNYRYIILGFYACFVGLLISGVINLVIFYSFSTGYAKLLSLLLILPLINGLTVFFKGLFEVIYYKYFSLTGMDQLGDIFKQIEEEEIEEYNNAINENTTY
ncbi:MAG: hypothetical protein PHE25_04950 [Candidatus Gracilibacteria bacterium]|nr:hypothetical protein [Candidatus Gracilibacteria bacterium]